MTSPQDPDVHSRVPRAVSSDTSPNDDLSDAWTLWADKELGGSAPATTDVGPTPSRSNPLPRRAAQVPDADLVRSRTATSEDLLEARATTTSSGVASTVGAAGGVAAAIGGAASTTIGRDTPTAEAEIADIEVPTLDTPTVPEVPEAESPAPIAQVKTGEPPTVEVTELDKQSLPDMAAPVAPLSDEAIERPVADRNMIGETPGKARFERVDSVEGGEESSSPRLGWLILGALIAAALVVALMWLWKRPATDGTTPDPSSQTTSSIFGSTPGVTSPTATTVAGLTGTTAVAGSGTGATGAGTLSLNTTSIAFGMGETSKGIVVRNMGSAPVSWTATGPLDQVNLTPAAGTLEPGAIAVIQVGRGLAATLGETAQIQISNGTGAPQIVTVTF